MPIPMKLMLIGDSNVGKTTIIQTLINQTSRPINIEPTNIVDMLFKTLILKKNNKSLAVKE